MDKALKQRLVGATVLVALAVILLPMLLSGPAEPGAVASQPIELPPRPDELQFETRRFPVGKNEPAATPLPGPALAQEERTPAQVSSEAARVADQDGPAPPADPGAVTTAEDIDADGVQFAEPGGEVQALTEPELESARVRPGDGRFLVQVASFSSPANADRLASRLRDDDFPVLLDTVESAAGTLHRVRIGPYSVEQEARDTLDRLAGIMPDLNPRLLDLQPEQGAPVAAPPDPMARWVVQVGSFASSDNAQGLVDRLRQAGYAASSVTVREGASTAYRVRVGPELERDAAVRIADELEQELGLAGLVMESD